MKRLVLVLPALLVAIAALSGCQGSEVKAESRKDFQNAGLADGEKATTIEDTQR